MKNHAMFTRILNNFLIEVWILISVISTSLNDCLAEAMFKLTNWKISVINTNIYLQIHSIFHQNIKYPF